KAFIVENQFAQTETTAFSRGYILTPLRGYFRFILNSSSSGVLNVRRCFLSEWRRLCNGIMFDDGCGNGGPGTQDSAGDPAHDFDGSRRVRRQWCTDIPRSGRTVEKIQTGVVGDAGSVST